jgi:hypothetical protein
MAAGPTIPEGWAEFWRLHVTYPLQAAQVTPQLHRWAEERLGADPQLEAAWQTFRNQIMEFRAQTPIDRAETAETTPAGRTTTFTARLKASAQSWRADMKTPAKVLGAVALLLALLFAGPIVYRAGQRWGLYFSCPYRVENYPDPDDRAKECWQMAGFAVMHGGKLPR